MHVGGTYFINRKAKDYFPEDAGLLNLLMSTLRIARMFPIFTSRNRMMNTFIIVNVNPTWKL